MTSAIYDVYPSPPAIWDRSWADALISSLLDAAAAADEAALIRNTGSAPTRTHEIWTDGAAIWQMVIPITQAFLETHNTAIAHGVANMGTLVSGTGVVLLSTGEQHIIPWTDGVVRSAFAVGATNLTSKVVGSPDWSAFVSGHVLIRFTRT